MLRPSVHCLIPNVETQTWGRSGILTEGSKGSARWLVVFCRWRMFVWVMDINPRTWQHSYNHTSKWSKRVTQAIFNLEKEGQLLTTIITESRQWVIVLCLLTALSSFIISSTPISPYPLPSWLPFSLFASALSTLREVTSSSKVDPSPPFNDSNCSTKTTISFFPHDVKYYITD